MTPRRFFYPQVVIELYHMMTSRREPHPTALHFSIDDRPGILRASDITATFNLSVLLANSAMSRLESWSDPIGGSEPSSGCETQDWDSLLDFFFLNPNWYLWL